MPGLSLGVAPSVWSFERYPPHIPTPISRADAPASISKTGGTILANRIEITNGGRHERLDAGTAA
jgi:hypothetical protein